MPFVCNRWSMHLCFLQTSLATSFIYSPSHTVLFPSSSADPLMSLYELSWNPHTSAPSCRRATFHLGVLGPSDMLSLCVMTFEPCCWLELNVKLLCSEPHECFICGENQVIFSHVFVWNICKQRLRLWKGAFSFNKETALIIALALTPLALIFLIVVTRI